MELYLLQQLLLRANKLCINTLIIQVYLATICQALKLKVIQMTTSRLIGFSTLIGKALLNRWVRIGCYYQMATVHTLQRNLQNIVRRRISIYWLFHPIQATFYNCLILFSFSYLSTTINWLLRWLCERATQTSTLLNSSTLYTKFVQLHLNPYLSYQDGQRLASFHTILRLY